MADTTMDLPRLVAATVNRLRLIQVDFADQPAKVREDYLSDEIEHALAKVLPDERAAFVDELKLRFPTWDGNVEITAPSQGSSNTDSDGDVIVKKDYLFLISRLQELAPTLTEEQRKTAIQRLKDVGLTEKNTGPEWPPAQLKALKTKLQLTDKDTVDAGKMLDLMSEFVGFANSLDQLVWATWKQVAPKADMKRPLPIQRSAAKFLTANEAEVNRPQVSADVDKLRQLTAGLISAIAQAGSLFAQRYTARFSIANIEAFADQKSGMLVSKEVKCWRHYKELAAELDAQAIETQIQGAIAEYTEALIKGRSRA